MTEQVLEETENLDGDMVETSESDDVTDSQNDDISEETDSERKNSSNWKKLSEAKKIAERQLRAEREEKNKLLEELREVKEWANSLYEDPNQKPFTKKEEQVVTDKESKLEEKIFLIENKDAKEHIEDIKSVREKYHMDFEEAWTFVKAKLPPESRTKKDFDVSTKTKTLPKDLTKISAEEALTLSKEERSAWRKANGWVS